MADERVVLVVEDDTDLRSMYRSWLSDDYTVEVAGDVNEARETFHDGVDIALLDRNLPGGDGSMLAGEFRSRNADCRLMVLTAVEPELAALELDVDAYLVKPVRRAQLLDAVRALERDDLAALGEIEQIRLW